MKAIRRAKRAGKISGYFCFKYKGNTKEMNALRRAKRAGGILEAFSLKYKGLIIEKDLSEKVKMHFRMDFLWISFTSELSAMIN